MKNSKQKLTKSEFKGQIFELVHWYARYAGEIADGDKYTKWDLNAYVLKTIRDWEKHILDFYLLED